MNKYTVDFDRLYILLNGDYLFHMRNLLSFFMEDELNQNQDKKQKKESFDKKPTPKQKFHSILFESTFKEIKNIRSSMNETMKNEEGTMKNDSTMFKRNIFSNLQETENKQNFSETFKKIENTWTQIISNPPNSISRSFCLKNFVKSPSIFLFNKILFNNFK